MTQYPSWYHPCLWPNAQLGLPVRSTDAELSQISFHYIELEWGVQCYNGCKLGLRPLMDPHQWLKQQTMREFGAGQYFGFVLRALCSNESQRTGELFQVVTCSILQGGAVGPVSDWQGVDLREGGTWRQAVLLDWTGASRALLPVCIVKLLVEPQQHRKITILARLKC